MAKRRRQVVARKKTASKRTRTRAKVKSSRAKAGKHVGRKTRSATAAKRGAAKTKAKKQGGRPRAKRVAPKKAAPQPPEATEEAVVVDIIEEPVPGVVVVTELEAVQFTKPPEDDEGSD
jgi:hypothetical protein